VGIFVGTGIGGGIICHGRLLEGAHGTAAEIGHMVVERGGPLCGCGNSGCFEALASRTAIERDLRAGLAAGRESMLSDLVGDGSSPIKSSLLRRGLKTGDALVTEVMTRASEVIGLACTNLRHIFDPEVLVLGGGVIEACGNFMLPIIEATIGSDPYMGSRGGCRLLEATLGDDVGVLGAVALARFGPGARGEISSIGGNLRYPTLHAPQSGKIAVNGEEYTTDVLVRADGTVRKRKKSARQNGQHDRHRISPEELERVLTGHPELLVIGTGHKSKVTLSNAAEQLLAERRIECLTAPTPAAADLFNHSTRRKAALMHIHS
jgi:glucokinase